jgi:hypothetical protein
VPFDSTDFTPTFAPLTGRALYQWRREEAARVWEGIPAEKLDMELWECGTAACALGWLARLRHDGWHFSKTRRACLPDTPMPAGCRVSVAKGKAHPATQAFDAADAYFGLPAGTSENCFGPEMATVWFHGCVDREDLAPSDVARTLLSLPFVGEG